MSYLNARQRNAVTSLILSVGVSETILKEKGLSIDEKKSLKKLQEWSEKYMKALFKRVPGEHDKIVRMLNDSECKLTTRQASKHQYVNIEVDVFEDLIEVAVMDKCKNCKGAEYEGCKLFKLQQNANVFMVQDRQGMCPYAYDEKEEPTCI